MNQLAGSNQICQMMFIRAITEFIGGEMSEPDVPARSIRHPETIFQRHSLVKSNEISIQKLTRT